MGTLVVMDVLIFRSYCFDRYNFSTSSCVDSNDPYYSNSCNDRDGCKGPIGYNGHLVCTGHEGSDVILAILAFLKTMTCLKGMES